MQVLQTSTKIRVQNILVRYERVHLTATDDASTEITSTSDRY